MKYVHQGQSQFKAAVTYLDEWAVVEDKKPRKIKEFFDNISHQGFCKTYVVRSKAF